MAHPLDNDNTHRETSSLYKATEGVDPTSINKRNVKLSERKNNPSQTPVKHSDFIVKSIDGIQAAGNKLKLKRGETATLEIQFTGGAEGFLEETRHTPQNFTWTVTQPDKIRILESTDTSGVYKEGSGHRAYKITVKNIWNKCADSPGETANVVVQCVFADQFNNNLDADHGYNTTHSITLTCAAINIFNQTTYINNGNSSANVAWDNYITADADSQYARGKNYSPDQNAKTPGVYWQGRKAKNGRQLTKVPYGTLDEQELIIEDKIIEPNLGAGWTTSPVVLDSINNVTYKWQKLINGVWTDVITSSQIDTFFPSATGGGTLETYFYGKAWINRINIQHHNGSGKYRCVQTIKGDNADPWTCVRTGQERDVTIYPKLAPFNNVSGHAYICKTSGKSILYINEPAHNNINVTYSFYYKLDKPDHTTTYLTLLGSKTTTNGVTQIDVPASLGNCYITVRAGVNGQSGVGNNSGYVWSSDDVLVDPEDHNGADDTTKTWFNTATVVRRILEIPKPPTIAVVKREGSNRQIITFQVVFEDVTAPKYHVYDSVQWRITAVDVDGKYTEVYPWTTVSTTGLSNVKLTKTCPVGSEITIEARSVYSGDMTSRVVGVHQENVKCGSEVAKDVTKTLACDQVCFIGPGGSPKKSGQDGDNLFQVPESRVILNGEHCGGDRVVHPDHKAVITKVERSPTGGPWVRASDGRADIIFKNNNIIKHNVSNVSTTPVYMGGAQLIQKRYTTPGTYTYTIPAGVESMQVLVVGGGGGGGAGYNAGGNGVGGAGAGGHVMSTLSVTPGEKYTVVVGAGGARGTGGGHNRIRGGNHGNVSRFYKQGSGSSSLMWAQGGRASSNSNGGAGGGASSGGITGGNGGGGYFTGGISHSGYGGDIAINQTYAANVGMILKNHGGGQTCSTTGSYGGNRGYFTTSDGGCNWSGHGHANNQNGIYGGGGAGGTSNGGNGGNGIVTIYVSPTSNDPDKTWTLDINHKLQESIYKTASGVSYMPKLYTRRINR